jgi:hypothetical protein
VAVPRPVLLAILGLALCVTAFVAVRGLGTGEEDLNAPAPIPATPAPAKKAEQVEPGARGRARTRPRVEQAAPVKPAEDAAKAPAAKPAPKLSPAEVAKLKDDALLVSVARALGQDDVVVLFFSRPGAADDTGARSAVRKLRGTKNVQVFSPRFEDLENYRPILAGAGVSQVPSIVIAKPGRKAVLVEGFVDRKSLRQQVEDALR